MNRPICIIVHCSATPSDKDFTLSQIDSMHRLKGYAGIGYHYYITKDGVLHHGRNPNTVGAHCLGLNDKSIGICYEGGLLPSGKSADTRAVAQKDMLIKLIRRLLVQYPLIRNIYPHFKFANKACPCFDAEKEYKYLLSKY